jgi:hypothetical protein
MKKLILILLAIILIPGICKPQVPYSATYYNPGHKLLSTGKQPKGDWVALKHHQGERVILITRSGNYRLRVLDRCPLRDRIDLPKKTFLKIFGKSGLKKGKIPVLIKFQKTSK